jgi:hypothetical protein
MECCSGSRVAIARGTVAWLIDAELQANDVLWVAIVQGLLPRGVNDIVGRRDDLGHVANN